MKSLILLAMGLITSLMTLAQNNKHYVVKHGTSMKKTFKFADTYLFPSFSSGKVNFKTGGTGGGAMNYNRLTGEIDFIKGKDTLALGDAEKIKNVVIGSNLFFVQLPQGYLLRVEVIDKVILAKREVIDLADRRKISNMDTFVQSSAPDPPFSNFVSGLPMTMDAKVDLVFAGRTEYYLGNEKGNFKIASNKTLLKSFPEKKEMLTNYLEEHTVDYTSLESIQSALKDIREMK
jgi:hypothetical protein